MIVSFLYLVSFVLTLTVEFAVACLFFPKPFSIFEVRKMAAVLAVTMCTHPIVHVILGFGFQYVRPWYVLLLLCVEAIVILVEAALLGFAFRLSYRKFLVFSICSNISSFLVGHFVFATFFA